jgi:hypothetical protein
MILIYKTPQHYTRLCPAETLFQQERHFQPDNHPTEQTYPSGHDINDAEASAESEDLCAQHVLALTRIWLGNL